MASAARGDQEAPFRIESIANIDAEAALLGALMIDNRLVPDVADRVEAHDFMESLHGRIFQTIMSEVSASRVANPVTLKPFFVNDAGMQSLGGPAYLAQLTGSGAAVIGARDFADQIAELSRIRQLYLETDAVLAEIRDMREDVSAAHFASKLEASAYSASSSKQEAARSFTLTQAIGRVLTRTREIQESGQPTGAIAPDLPELTRIAGPLQASHMITLAGRPGMGKSALMCTAMRSMAQAGYGVGGISLEMSDLDLGTRMAADLALYYGERIKHADIRDAKLTDREMRVLDWCAEQVRDLPLRMVDAYGLTIGRVAMKARQMKRELEAKGHQLHVLFIDYLQLIDADKPSGNKVADVTFVSNRIKQLAKELDCAVVALSQLSRAVEQREDKRPHLSDLRESGAIEQDSDVVLFVYREEYYLQNREPDSQGNAKQREAWAEWDLAMRACRGKVELLCEKHRHGAVGRALMTFIGEYQAVRGQNFYSENAGALFDDEA